MNATVKGDTDSGPRAVSGKLAHDLSNVLTVMYGLQEELGDLAAADPHHQQTADIFATVVQRVQDIGLQLQKMTRGETGGGGEPPAP